MKIYSQFLSLTILFAMSLAFASCGSKSQSDADNGIVSVDYVLTNADELVGDTITVEGLCSHLCAHGGKKAFIVGNDESQILRCEAFPLMGKPFSTDDIQRTLQVNGILRENRIDEEAINEMEAQYAEALAQEAQNEATHQEGCDTEKKATGQAGLSSFEERMADYRSRIAQREAAEGKPYLSFYYLDAISYERPLPQVKQ